MAKQISVSEARARLTELAHRIVGSPGRVEYIAHRDLDDDLAMTTRSHMRFLEDSLAQLRARVAGDFRLAESMATELTDAELEAALAAVQHGAAEAAADKQRDLRG
jgi:hypothetical protein